MLIDKEVVAKAKKKLGDKNATIIAETLGLEGFDERNFKSCCPYHDDNDPSFIYNPKMYNYHCFGCKKNVDIIDAYMESGLSYIGAVKKLFGLAGVKYSFGEANVKTKHQYRYPKEVKCDNKDRVYEYLSRRKISKTTVDYADVREDDKGNIVFNYYDSNDVLTTVKYRPARRVKKGETKTWCQKNADTTPLLFNMNRINTENPLLICEGEMDALAAIESGYQNTVSVPFGAENYAWINENWEWLEQFDKIIICSDNDKAGIAMQKEVIFRLGSWRCRVVELPDVIVRKDEKLNDLNEVLFFFGKEKVMEVILNAKDSPVDEVVDFADIEDVDLNDIDGIQTGFEDIDRELMKLFYGTLNILTGVNGSGKTSLLSQLVCQSLEQNKNVFFYSGELPNHQTKNWINYILAGQRNLDKHVYKGAEYWKVTSKAKAQINKETRGQLFIYKDGYSRKVSSIMKTMENTVRKFGTKLLILDNLTAMSLENNDNNKYQKQEEFITGLIDFAKKFNVVVFLVVHPHKMDTIRRMNKMDIQGVMALTDLAHRVLSLYRVSPQDKEGIKSKKKDGGWWKEPIKYDVLFDVLKDRMRGKEGYSAGLYYDYPSRRFFTNEEDLDMQYKWDKNEYDTPLPYPPKQLEDEEDEIFGEVNK